MLFKKIVFHSREYQVDCIKTISVVYSGHGTASMKNLFSFTCHAGGRRTEKRLPGEILSDLTSLRNWFKTWRNRYSKQNEKEICL